MMELRVKKRTYVGGHFDGGETGGGCEDGGRR